jgi:hypothetical protein
MAVQSSRFDRFSQIRLSHGRFWDTSMREGRATSAGV